MLSACLFLLQILGIWIHTFYSLTLRTHWAVIETSVIVGDQAWPVILPWLCTFGYYYEPDLV
jgi:hypothetical protein